MSEQPHMPARPQAYPKQSFSINKPFFAAPPQAGRKITAGFSYLQRIGKSANLDVWFPEALQRRLDLLVARGAKLGPANFPAEWAAVRQFELLQEAGNYKIYDMDASYLTRTMVDLAKNMRAGGYRVTVASIGSYANEERDELEILDRRLQDRISKLTHMLYLEEQSAAINAGFDKSLAEERWDYQTALPHIGLTLGARDLFLPGQVPATMTRNTVIVPAAPHEIVCGGWMADGGVTDAATGEVFACVKAIPKTGQYTVRAGVYRFAAADGGREVMIGFMQQGGSERHKPSSAEIRHRKAKHFFDILSLLPQKHIVHDMAVGLQLPESVAEQEWIYLADGDMKLFTFNTLLNDLFAPFDGIALGELHGREGAGREIKSSVQHMRGYGNRLTPGADGFYRNAAVYALQ